MISRRTTTSACCGLALAALAACRPVEPSGLTELLVLVDTDLGAPDLLDQVEITVEGPAAFSTHQVVALDALDAPRFPLTLGLVHRGGPLEGATITVTGTGTASGTSLTQTAVASFVPGESRLVPFVLADACVGATCPADRTCTGRSRCDLLARDPASLPASTTVTRVAAGQFMACARLTTGRVKCWGRSFIDDPNPPLPLATSTPTLVPNLDDATEIAVGVAHACAIRRGGTVACWGVNDNHMVTPDDIALQPDAVDVAGLTDVVQLALGRGHSCARLASGEVKCWGAATVGQLGNGSTTSSSTPVHVALPEPAAELSSGLLFTCARGTSGQAYCWGFNNFGVLGDGTTTRSATPVAVVGLTDAIELATGADHACARRRGGTVVCWGTNANGQLGDGTRVVHGTPAPVLVAAGGAPLTGAVQLALSNGSTCARMRGGRVNCWGGNGSGQLGDGTTTTRSVPGLLLDGGTRAFEDALAVTGGAYYFCAVDRTRAVLCWGINQDRQLGTEATGSTVTNPHVVVGLP